MNKITRYTLLLSLSCLTSVPTRAEVVSSGDKLLEIISNNQTGSTVSIELGNNIILPQNVDVNGNAVVDGTEQKYKIDGNMITAQMADDEDRLRPRKRRKPDNPKYGFDQLRRTNGNRSDCRQRGRRESRFG